MSKAEELLNSLTEDEIAAFTIDRATEPHIIVNPDRSITVPAELKTIAVQFDHNVETVVFDCPRFWDEHDLSTMAVFINYIAPGKDPAQYPCDDVTVDEVDESIMHFTWTISGNVTEKDGTISFLICVKSTDEDGNLSNRWSSRLNQEMTVLKGMDASGEEEFIDPDLITSMLERLLVLEHRPEPVNLELTTDFSAAGEGKAADAKAVGEALANLPTGGSGGTVELDTTLTVEGKAADAKAVGDKFSDLPISVADDGYTDITGLRQMTAASFEKVDNTITVTVTLEGNEIHTSVVTLDENGRPSIITANGVESVFTWTGFDATT